MIGEHNVNLGSETVGQVNVTKEGLYYRIRCRCQLTGTVIYRLVAQWPEKTESLGILAPEAGAFTLTAKIPVKRAGEGQPVFRILPNHEKMPESFVPIQADEPFAYLSRLENAYLQTSGDTVGVVIEEAPDPDQPDSDQSQEPPRI